MPTNTYTAIGNYELDSASSSIIFSSIDTAKYRDLKIVIEGQCSGSAAVLYARFNGDESASSHYYVMSRGYGGGTQSVAGSSTRLIFTQSGIEQGQRGLFELDVLDAGATDKHKPVIIRSDYYQDAGGNYCTETWGGRYASNSAITSVEIIVTVGNMSAGSTFRLYGIEA